MTPPPPSPPTTVLTKRMRSPNSGPNHPCWKEKPSYSALHKSIRREFVLPNRCPSCNEEKKLTLACTGSYTRDEDSINDNWAALCYRCHFRLDRPETRDMDERVCIFGCAKTTIDRHGHPHWYRVYDDVACLRLSGIYLCRNCYERERNRNRRRAMKEQETRA